MRGSLWILFFICLAVHLCMIGLLLEYYSRAIETGTGGAIELDNSRASFALTTTGGAFDLSAFFQSIKKKYSSLGKNSTIEVEIKLSRIDLFDKIIEWIRNKKYTESNTLNQIWSQDGLIKTTDSNSTEKWSRKTRISKYVLPVGKLTIALEESDIDGPAPIGDPIVIRKKRRISTQLNKHWRIDCTWVNDEQTPEIEMEYISKDYWNAPQHIHEIETFLIGLE